MSRKALIIVDMLNDFINEDGALFCGASARALVPFVRKRLERFRQQNRLVLYLQDSHDKNDREFDKFPPHCITGTWGSEIISELAPRPNEPVVPKKRYSGFYGTPLDRLLAEAEIEEVEVVGVCSSICVMDTVGGLANRDYQITVPRLGIADFDPAFHAFALKRMERLYGARLS